MADETETRDLLRKSYDMATQRLRKANEEDFIKFRREAAEELGIEWEPRLSQEQRAEQEFDALLEQYPHLADRIAERTRE